MRVPLDLPEIALARVRTSGAPYRAGDTLSLAFTSPSVARLTLHERELVPDDVPPGDTLVPETIGVEILRAAGPFAAGERLMLSFVDPRIARIHPLVSGTRRPFAVPTRNDAPATRPEVSATQPARPAMPAALTAASTDETPAPVPASFAAARRLAPAPAANPNAYERHGACVRLDWNADRVRRFVQLVDKLFTVDRLGWYRHAFAMRLLVPDAISLGEPEAEREAQRHLRDLRAAAVETLGRPLLAAFMPSFVVTPEWLDSLDLPAAARALAGLREAIRPHLDDAPFALGAVDARFELGAAVDTPFELGAAVGPASSIGFIDRATFLAAPGGSVEAVLPAFIATMSADEPVSARSREYRKALLELFGQTAQSAEAVRLRQLAQPNHVLDDRLWHLVGAVQAAFGEPAAV